jgi:hypothetical protein
MKYSRFISRVSSLATISVSGNISFPSDVIIALMTQDSSQVSTAQLTVIADSLTHRLYALPFGA